MAKKNPLTSIKKRVSSRLKDGPHDSFRITHRRDYVRSLELPGYFAFTKYVNKTLWTYRKTFISLTLIYALLTILMVGIASQDTYTTLLDTLQTTSGDFFNGVWGGIGKTSLLFMTAISGGFSQDLSDSQQIYAGFITLLTWLTSVWLLRNILAGHNVKLRDGLYNAGSPIISTFVVALLFMVQLLPMALAFIGYSAASATGLLDGGIEAMLFWVAAGLLTLLSLYWITSTFFALIIITIPGMYPLQAVKTASELVIGRRLRILLRLLWMMVTLIFGWALVMIPMISIDLWIKDLWPAASWVPTVPLTMLILSSLTIVWVSSYIYLLYRKVVADDSDTA
jgi:hypothetical protein